MLASDPIEYGGETERARERRGRHIVGCWADLCYLSGWKTRDDIAASVHPVGACTGIFFEFVGVARLALRPRLCS